MPYIDFLKCYFCNGWETNNPSNCNLKSRNLKSDMKIEKYIYLQQISIIGLMSAADLFRYFFYSFI